MRAINVSRGTLLADAIQHARTLWARSRGLLGRKGLEPGEGLLLQPCSGIHTFGMRFPIDAVFLDREANVVHLVQEMGPQRVSRYVFKAHSVLELPPGTIQSTGTRLGDRLILED